MGTNSQSETSGQSPAAYPQAVREDARVRLSRSLSAPRWDPARAVLDMPADDVRCTSCGRSHEDAAARAALVQAARDTGAHAAYGSVGAAAEAGAARTFVGRVGRPATCPRSREATVRQALDAVRAGVLDLPTAAGVVAAHGGADGLRKLGERLSAGWAGDGCRRAAAMLEAAGDAGAAGAWDTYDGWVGVAAETLAGLREPEPADDGEPGEPDDVGEPWLLGDDDDGEPFDLGDRGLILAGRSLAQVAASMRSMSWAEFVPEFLSGAHRGKHGSMRVERRALGRRIPGRHGRDWRATREGVVPVAWHRAVSDGSVFGLVRPMPGGTVLVDTSGSMAWSLRDLEAVVGAFPAATVALYDGRGDAGVLRIVADRGRTVRRASDLDGIGSGNIVDFPALSWLIRQREPRVWVCDGFVTGQFDTASGAVIRDCWDVLNVGNPRVIQVPLARASAVKHALGMGAGKGWLS